MTTIIRNFRSFNEIMARNLKELWHLMKILARKAKTLTFLVGRNVLTLVKAAYGYVVSAVLSAVSWILTKYAMFRVAREIKKNLAAA